MVFNALDGSLIRAIDTGVGSAGNPNGIGAVTPIYDGNRNIVAVYAGDKHGNLWKFDLSSTTRRTGRSSTSSRPATTKPLFTATNGVTARPIHQAPRVTQHPLGGLYVTFGTGKYFEVGDPSDTDDQGIFAIWDKGQVAPIAFNEVERSAPTSTRADPDTFRRLYAPDLRNFDWNDKGFWVRLRTRAGTANGERIIAPLILDGGMLVAHVVRAGKRHRPVYPGRHVVPVPDRPGRRFHARRVRCRRCDDHRPPGESGHGRRPGSGVSAGGPGADRRGQPWTASDVTTMLSNPKYRMSGNRPVQQGATGTCVHAGLRVDGTVARIPTNCAGLMPLRSWRPMR